MRSNKLKLFLICLAAIAALLLLCGCSADNDAQANDEAQSTESVSEVQEASGMMLFANGEYKFSFIVPEKADAEFKEVRN